MPENPYQSPTGKGEAFDSSSRTNRRVVGWVLSLAVIGLLIALLIPAPRGAREAARRNQCLNNLKQIALALLNYEQDHGALPPAYTVDDDGNRLHSWRTLILPYMEEKALYDSIDFSKPWDDPVNQHARETAIDSYMCPSADHELGLTTFLAVVGPESAFSGSDQRRLADVTDEHGQTITVIDAPAGRAVHWMSPGDLSIEDILSFDPKARWHHPGVFQAVFLDGRARAIQHDCPPEILRAMLTIAGGESFDE